MTTDSSSSTGVPSDFPSTLSLLFSRPSSSIPLLPRQPFDGSLTSLIHKEATSASWSPALEASVHLLNDDLDSAHDIVTDLEHVPICALPHGVLHRRQGEWWNSQYWASQFPSAGRNAWVKETYGERGAKGFFDDVKKVANGSKGGSSACGAKNALDGVKEQQEKELKGLVVWMWEQDGRK
ncbi:hypothetical protein BDZ90DRAFT_257994 [Jaminaea rosea]|uniref:Uncharacterized protein n=1 Tax=Jaminaea rosea TaxID=1569628 RepID=A0A316V676_9BASI|nr:hypothetical protein BDZ90DRAFT_257994 [Jaminaea rosea]PWN30945.1 hypothetical protein BDZ90DRAFT_257994 [Jaminaea rosea]